MYSKLGLKKCFFIFSFISQFDHFLKCLFLLHFLCMILFLRAPIVFVSVIIIIVTQLSLV